MNLKRMCILAAGLFFIICMCCGCGHNKIASVSSYRTYTPGYAEALTPLSSGESAAQGGPLSLDFSHTDQGYFTGILSVPDKKVNIQVTGPDQVVYHYFIHQADTLSVFPLTAGNGTYLIMAFEQITDDQYAALFSHILDVSLEHEFLPFLYPNQYVDFSADSEAVHLAAELSSDAPTDLDALKTIYNHITSSITYDTQKARTVETGYLPNIDETLTSGTGICFDYAALTASMLRSLSIPTRLEIGYSNDVRHAWIDVYIQSMGWIDNAIEFNGDEWTLLDPTFAASAQDSDIVNDYLGDGSNYTLQYVR